MTEPLHVALNAPGPWMLHQVEGRPVYMRASDVTARVTVRCAHAGAPHDLGVACDLDRPDASRLVVGSHQDDWVTAAAVQQDLLERAMTVWRRYGADDPGPVKTTQAGPYVYEFWADLAAARVEITRRAIQPASVVIDEHLGYADRLDTLAAQVRLREVATIPTPLLYQVRALALQAWQLGIAAGRARMEGAAQ